jgi:hypothetical protein
MDSIVVAYMKEFIESKSEGRKVQGSLKRIIDLKKIEFGGVYETTHHFMQCDLNECGVYLQY